MDEVNEWVPSTKRRKTRLDEIMATMSPEDVAELRAAMADRSVPSRAILAALHKRGYQIAETTLSRIRTYGLY
jgi:hypothetical protein